MQVGYKRQSGSYGGTPSLAVDNTLDRKFDVAAPDRAQVTGIIYMRTLDRLPGRRDRLLLSPRGGFVAALGGMAAHAEATGTDTLGSGLAVHQHGLDRLHPGSQY